MERKTKIEIAFALAVVLIFFVVLVVWRMQQPDAQEAEPPRSTAGSMTQSQDKPGAQGDTSTTPPTPVVQETSANTVARAFVERLGSYSSEADAQNVDDILSMATPAFQQQLLALAREARATAGGEYYGVSTVVITAPIVVNASATETTLSMTTQREETRDTPGNTTVIYQSITLTLVKSGTTWLVSNYAWK